MVNTSRKFERLAEGAFLFTLSSLILVFLVRAAVQLAAVDS
jgi:hypothetical protein